MTPPVDPPPVSPQQPSGQSDPRLQRTLQHLINLSGHTDDDFAVLAAHAERTRPWIAGWVAAFYEALYAYTPTRSVFRDGERAEREASLRDWLLEITSGRVGPDFWSRQWIIGLVHIQREVPQAFMLSMMSRLQSQCLERCLADFAPGEALRLYGAFKRVTDIVAGLAVEAFLCGYVDAVADVTGMKGALIERMAHVAVDRLLARARA